MKSCDLALIIQGCITLPNYLLFCFQLLPFPLMLASSSVQYAFPIKSGIGERGSSAHQCQSSWDLEKNAAFPVVGVEKMEFLL